MVDILLATYNGEKYIRQLLDSIIEQTYTNWVLLIRDDGSTDNTVNIINEYVSQYEKKIKLFINTEPTGSAKANFLKLVHDSDSQYVMFCDQDDLWDREKITISLNEICRLGKFYGEDIPLMVYTDLQVINQDGKILADSFNDYMNLAKKINISNEIIQNCVTGCTMMINYSLLEYLKKVLDTDKILMHDHLAAIVALAYGKVSYINKQTIAYRQHEDNSVGAKNSRSASYLYNRFKRGKSSFNKDIEASSKQVEYILDLFGIDKINKKDAFILDNYSRLYTFSKIKKIKFYFRYRVFKNGIIRRIMQIIWA